MGERVSTFDALVEAAAEAITPLAYNEGLDLPGTSGRTARLLARPVLNAVLALVHEGGGTLTETECEECHGGGSVVLRGSQLGEALLRTRPCPSCSGLGRRWQIGKLGDPLETMHEVYYRFVPRSEGDGT